MLLTTDHIREILVVKHNCTLQSFIEHVQLLGTHFNFENSSKEDIVSLLNEVLESEYEEYKNLVYQASDTSPVEEFLVKKEKRTVA